MNDGFPLYGPYGYASNTNTTIKLMTTGYQLRTDMAANTVRNTLMNCATGGAWVMCEPWFTGSQTLCEPCPLGEPKKKK